MRIPLLGGAYVARSRIANAQRCVNYFPEKNREDSPVPFTYYQRPGLRALTQGPQNPVRMLYEASNGTGFCCIGNIIYRLFPDFTLSPLGGITTNTSTPVRAIDNGQTVMFVDGSPFGFQCDLSTFAYSVITDGTGTFTGATNVAYIDTYMIWNFPDSVEFGSTLSNSITFDPLYFAGKVGYPDHLIGLTVNRHEILLFGSYKTEIWYNAGNATFPFAQLPGAYIEHGCIAPYTIQSTDIQTFWLGQDLAGNGIVLGLKGYDVKRISNHALEYAIQKMPNISDAFAYVYQQFGHYFYVITFPSGDQTWAYDLSMESNPEMAWHQRAWTDPNGNLRRERLNCVASIYGKIIGGDWQNGLLYEVDPTYYLDDAAGAGGVKSPISYIKGFPHFLQATLSGMMPGQTVGSELKRMRYKKFLLDLETGEHPLDSNGEIQKITLRVSTDRGQSFFDAPLQISGAPGEYETYPLWNQTVANARDVVFEISHSIPGPAAMNGAFVDVDLMES